MDSTTVILLVGMVLVIGVLLAVRIMQRIGRFREDLYYINLEIHRSTGEERNYWKREKRRLWLSLLPFYRR